jgi:hypothetical protein
MFNRDWYNRENKKYQELVKERNDWKGQQQQYTDSQERMDFHKKQLEEFNKKIESFHYGKYFKKIMEDQMAERKLIEKYMSNIKDQTQSCKYFHEGGKPLKDSINSFSNYLPYMLYFGNKI